MSGRAPQHVDLIYRKVGPSHVFASKGIRGLVHVGDFDLETAFTKTLSALSTHVFMTYGIEATYVGAPFAEVAQKISEGRTGFVEARLDQESGARA